MRPATDHASATPSWPGELSVKAAERASIPPSRARYPSSRSRGPPYTASRLQGSWYGARATTLSCDPPPLTKCIGRRDRHSVSCSTSVTFTISAHSTGKAEYFFHDIFISPDFSRVLSRWYNPHYSHAREVAYPSGRSNQKFCFLVLYTVKLHILCTKYSINR